MHRPTKRLSRILVCAAAVPAVLVVAGCSSGSGSDSSDGAKEGSSAKASAPAAKKSPEKKVEPAKFSTLPQACSALSKKTLSELVPKGDSKAGSSEDETSRASCSWSSLDNNGVKGSQYRWLNVSLVRFDSDVNRGSGAELASAYFTKQVKDAEGTDGAKGVKTSAVKGTGDEASLVRYDRSYKDKKKDVTSKQQTIVTRVDNVVVTVDFNGSGLAGDKTPDADELSKDAQKATQEVVAAVRKAGAGSDSGSGSGSADPSPSKSAAKAGA
jgi:hypothetical protein